MKCVITFALSVFVKIIALFTVHKYIVLDVIYRREIENERHYRTLPSSLKNLRKRERFDHSVRHRWG